MTMALALAKLPRMKVIEDTDDLGDDDAEDVTEDDDNLGDADVDVADH